MAKTGAERQADFRRRLIDRDPEGYKKKVKRNACLQEANKNKNPGPYLWRLARNRAVEYQLEFTISPDDVIVPVRCPVLGLVLKRGPRMNASSPTIDRIDNSKGYTPENIIVISYRANVLKGNATLTELKQVAQFYGRFT